MAHSVSLKCELEDFELVRIFMYHSLGKYVSVQLHETAALFSNGYSATSIFVKSHHISSSYIVGTSFGVMTLIFSKN